MDKPRATPKDFFLWAGAMISLWAGVIAFISLLFDYINYTLPNPLAYYSTDPWGSVSYEMASLIVLAPVFLVLMRVVRRSIEADATRAEVWVRRWALYLTVFAAGTTVVVDLITLVMYFLRGEELTAGFLLKVLVVFLVAGAGFLHFLADIRGYWKENPLRARMVNWATGIVVLAAIVAGFFIVGTPQEARLYRFDEQKVNDLTSIQYQVITYWQQKEVLPKTLEELYDSLSSWTLPTDPQAGDSYTYKRYSPLDFGLCATFNFPSRPQTGKQAAMPTEPAGATYAQDNWQHEAGQVCFDRSIDPQRYPPFSKTR